MGPDGPPASEDLSCTLSDDGRFASCKCYAADGPTFPTPPSCIPDAPGTQGCPLYDPATTVLPPGTDCAAICEAS